MLMSSGSSDLRPEMKAGVNSVNPKSERSSMSSSAWARAMPLSTKGSKTLAARKARLRSYMLPSTMLNLRV